MIWLSLKSKNIYSVLLLLFLEISFIGLSMVHADLFDLLSLVSSIFLYIAIIFSSISVVELMHLTNSDKVWALDNSSINS